MKIENEEQYREALRALELIWCDDNKGEEIIKLADQCSGVVFIPK